MLGVWVVESGNGDDHVDQNAKYSFQVVTLAVTEKVADHQNGKDEDYGIKDLEVEVELVTKTPRDDDNERGIEEGGLDGCTEDVRESKVHLVVPSLVNGCDVLGGFFDDGNQDQAHKAKLISVVNSEFTGPTYASLI